MTSSTRSLLCSCLIVFFASVGLPEVARCQDALVPNVVPNRTLLPEKTQGFVEILDVPRFEKRWKNSFAGAITSEPALEPFFKREQENIRKRLTKAGIAANLTFENISAMASGNALLAWVKFDDDSNAIVMLVDTRGRDKQFEFVIQQADNHLKQNRGATLETTQYSGHAISVYTLKKKVGQIHAEQFCYVRIDGRLLVSDKIEAVQQLIDRLAGTGKLIDSSEYKAVEAKIGDSKDDCLHWFVKPFGLADIIKSRGGGLKKQQLDLIRLLKDQGFNAIQAAGGRVRFDATKYDVHHTTYIYAPPTTSLPSKYELAGRMLQFDNAKQQDPPSWVLPNIASYLDGNWNMREAFWASESLVNEAVGDKIFRRVIDGIKKDRDGPQIDLVNDIIANLKSRFILITDNTKPIDKQSERMLIAVEVNNPEVVKAAVDKAMKADPNAMPVDFPAHNWIWQVTRPESGDNEIELEGFDDFNDFGDDALGEDGGKKPLLNQWAITVYDGYLMFSSHSKMLVETIEHHRKDPQPKGLLAEADFKRLVPELLTQTAGGTHSIYRVLRPRLSLAVKYELLRRGELKDSDSVLAALIRRATFDAQYQHDDDVDIDGSKLPEFSVIQKHLQPSGTIVTTEPDGWRLQGVVLKPE